MKNFKRIYYIPVGNYKPRIDENGQKHCLNCDIILPKGRQRYCSDKCTTSFWTKNNWSLLRQEKLIESNFTCQRCGFHVEVPMENGKYTMEYWEVSSLFVADHIKPVCMGGGELDKSNIQILCSSCNKEKTRKDLFVFWEEKRLQQNYEAFLNFQRVQHTLLEYGGEPNQAKILAAYEVNTQ